MSFLSHAASMRTLPFRGWESVAHLDAHAARVRGRGLTSISSKRALPPHGVSTPACIVRVACRPSGDGTGVGASSRTSLGACLATHSPDGLKRLRMRRACAPSPAAWSLNRKRAAASAPSPAAWSLNRKRAAASVEARRSGAQVARCSFASESIALNARFRLGHHMRRMAFSSMAGPPHDATHFSWAMCQSGSGRPSYHCGRVCSAAAASTSCSSLRRGMAAASGRGSSALGWYRCRLSPPLVTLPAQEVWNGGVTAELPAATLVAPVPRVHRLLNTRYRGPSWATCRGAHLLGSATKSPLYRVFKSRTCGALPDWSTAAKWSIAARTARRERAEEACQAGMDPQPHSHRPSAPRGRLSFLWNLAARFTCGS
eukprot:scaffold9162_cov91-Phaeocystis_antarctica.AAC.1